MSVLERLSSAMLSSDLRVDPDHRTDVDYIIAAGLAGGTSARLYLANSRTQLRRAIDTVATLTARLDMRRSWRLTDDEIRAVARLALLHHIEPACPVCHGRGYELQLGTPMLSDRVCKSCRGTGRRPIQRKLQSNIVQVIAALEQIDSVTESAIKRLLR